MSTELRRVTERAVREALEKHPTRNPTVLGVLLAAGESTRFGTENKLLAEVDGTPLVRHAARTLLDSRVSSVVAVLGHQQGAVRDALSDGELVFAANEEYEQGMSTSVRRGVVAATEMDAAAAVFLPGDMPFVDAATVDLLLDAYRADIADAVAPIHRGQRGNPVLFDRRYFASLRSVSGDVGGRGVLLESDGLLIETDDAGTVSDIDTQADLESRG
ncbi:MAG TPA: nucleotidyltransferase family protein [Halococcus sp.]|nr:nucleotidyltransferase family protein [Halococcus sp.]